MPEGLAFKTRLFADDTLIYLVVSTMSDALALQSDLVKLAAWEETWMMKFHSDKCFILSVTRKRKLTQANYTLHGHTLKAVDSTKYLGLTITSDLSWGNHINQICVKAIGTLSFFKRNLNIASVNVKMNAYLTLVRPTVDILCVCSLGSKVCNESLPQPIECVRHP